MRQFCEETCGFLRLFLECFWLGPLRSFDFDTSTCFPTPFSPSSFLPRHSHVSWWSSKRSKLNNSPTFCILSAPHLRCFLIVLLHYSAQPIKAIRVSVKSVKDATTMLTLQLKSQLSSSMIQQICTCQAGERRGEGGGKKLFNNFPCPKSEKSFRNINSNFFLSCTNFPVHPFWDEESFVGLFAVLRSIQSPLICCMPWQELLRFSLFPPSAVVLKA
jgi:hypothetical protein